MPTRTIADRYELIEEISAGGMGTVWRGYDKVLDREIAVKVIKPEMLTDPAGAPDLAERFSREARVTARIQHHGVPQVYDAVLDADAPDQMYLVMEYVRGVELRRCISAADRLPVSWVAAVAAQIATVLSHAHAIPVVHRDLKPDNILVTADGTVKVLDFGIAAILSPNVTKLTVTGTPLGTSRYMSPEQVTGAPVTPHSDLYALGCVLHELLTGEPVFDETNQYRLWDLHLHQEPRPIRDLRADVPEDLQRLVHDLLAKRPDERPDDAYAVYERLLPLLPAPGSAMPDSGRPASVPDPTLIYRRPNAPRPRTEVHAPAPIDTAPQLPSRQTTVRNQIDEALRRSAELLGEDRFVQAADVLGSVIDPARQMLAPEDPDLLKSRFQRALILFLGGDFRAALPEFDALTTVYGHVHGASSEQALRVRLYAAQCRANMGLNTTALRQLDRLRHDARAQQGDGADIVLDIRQNIGMLRWAEGDLIAARHELASLHQDLSVLRGADDERTYEVAELLRRLQRHSS